MADIDDGVALRPMHQDALERVSAWLSESHVARWWNEPPGEELSAIRRRLRGEADTATRMLTVTEGGRAAGWAQWYRWEDYPEEAEAIGAGPGEVGMDYAIGEPAATGRGVGRRMIAALVREIRRHHPGVGIVVGPAAANAASRAVLERNGFGLVEVRPVATEPTDEPVAIYRLDPVAVRMATVADARAGGRAAARPVQPRARRADAWRQHDPGRLSELIGSGDTDVVLGGRAQTSESECYD